MTSQTPTHGLPMPGPSYPPPGSSSGLSGSLDGVILTEDCWPNVPLPYSKKKVGLSKELRAEIKALLGKELAKKLDDRTIYADQIKGAWCLLLEFLVDWRRISRQNTQRQIDAHNLERHKVPGLLQKLLDAAPDASVLANLSPRSSPHSIIAWIVRPEREIETPLRKLVETKDRVFRTFWENCYGYREPNDSSQAMRRILDIARGAGGNPDFLPVPGKSETALMRILRAGSDDKMRTWVEYLIKICGADPNMPSPCSAELISQLRGANITPLEFLVLASLQVRAGSPPDVPILESIKTLVSEAADVNRCGALGGMTPLIIALEIGHSENRSKLVHVLAKECKTPADPNQPDAGSADGDGFSPVRHLLERHIRSRDGDSRMQSYPFDWTQRSKTEPESKPDHEQDLPAEPTEVTKAGGETVILGGSAHKKGDSCKDCVKIVKMLKESGATITEDDLDLMKARKMTTNPRGAQRVCSELYELALESLA